MFALQFSEYDGPEALSVGEAPEPHAGPGQIRIVVRAASVNPADWKFLSGMYAQGKPLEDTGYPGYDAAGVVDEVGEGLTDVAVGDDVFGLGAHTQAEYAVLNAWARKPASLDWAVAAAAGVVAETAERVLRLLGVTEGTTLFIDGGSGGVGSATTQIAKARGATVIASASEARHDYLREIGAIPVVYGEGMVDRVRGLDVNRIDAVLDAVGKTPIEDLISLAPEPSSGCLYRQRRSRRSRRPAQRRLGRQPAHEGPRGGCRARGTEQTRDQDPDFSVRPSRRGVPHHQRWARRREACPHPLTDKSARPVARSIWARQPSTRSAAEQSAVMCRTSPSR